MSVKIRQRKNKNGSTSLVLDIYHNGQRKFEFLKELTLQKGTSPAIKQRNKENLALAERIATKKAHELAAGDFDIVTDTGKKTEVTKWMQAYVDKYDKGDKRNMQGALNHFKTFLVENKLTGLTFGRISELVVSDFQDYLISFSKGEGASSYFARFKKMMKRAYKENMMIKNVAADVPTIVGKARKKDTLTPDEIKLLWNTPTESDQVKKAFLFCCMTGLRWCDVSMLKWHNIQKESIVISQSKTDEDVTINMNGTALQLIGKRGKPDQLVFELPTANGANKTVKAWVRRAGIQKEITWHNARHSAGTNLAFNGENLLTIAAILGHTSTKHTQRYVKAAQALKQRATDGLSVDLNPEN
ncbi:MAG: site-specific integrase [Chitinophagaceae bacterium]|nr:site-specific integrase [Chitinophagaceae bacterium]